ncbi:efflux RND transporter periplasmic adaptor subunit [Variovorax ginsengisoli]|uniref:RND family efflux transporter MFP subunit n=1 Tax=Variovorax ginsengisoli TaxID=363844 RepID=A0ABT9S3Y7_9BURK|nr:efflux RND transporter periplasmic adaptor subunit [Variovorax ginsengisoli]MDP9899052.1 RND family efflux transporter MFP subunit [Variovorax ginsengisoli]
MTVKYPVSSSRVRGTWALAVSVLALAACSRPPAAQEPLRAVKVVDVGRSAFQTEPEFSADVKARVESRVGFRVAGKVTRREVELGQHVQAGQVLAQLDPQDYRLAAEAARAQQAAALTNRDLAQADLGRYRELRAQNFISGAELERRESTYKSAQAQLEQAQAQTRSQGNQASYTTLVADAPGVVTAVEAEPGQVVAAGATVVRIAQDGARDVVFAVPEDEVRQIPVGSPVTVRGWVGGQTLEGKVREVAASADPVTRTYGVKVAIDAATAPALGATVYARPKALSRSGTPVLKLPTSALREDAGATAVWVLDRATMTVRSQRVQVDTADGNEAVVTSGLAPGATVVVAGVHVLSPGQKVTLYQDKASAAAANAAGTARTASVPAPAAPASGAAR